MCCKSHKSCSFDAEYVDVLAQTEGLLATSLILAAWFLTHLSKRETFPGGAVCVFPRESRGDSPPGGRHTFPLCQDFTFFTSQALTVLESPRSSGELGFVPRQCDTPPQRPVTNC